MKQSFKNTWLLILGIVFLVSCSNNEKPINGINVSTTLGIFLKNNQGVDILGSEKYPEGKIYANYLIDGKIVQNTSNAYMPANPDNVLFTNQSGIHTVTIFLNHAEEEEYPITYIHWNDTDTDTIKAQYIRSGGSVVLSKCWILENGVWKEINPGETTIIK